MNRTNSEQQDMLFYENDYIHVENASIVDVVATTESTGYILISYGETDENDVVYMMELRLNVGDDTIIMDEMGEPLNLYNLYPGMQIDADFSSAMTRSIPPQSRAYRIVVLQEDNAVNITTDRVVSVDTDNWFLTTGNPYDINDQFVFTISNETLILNQDGDIISLEDIQPGQLVRVEHALFQTLSIPPQSPAYLVQIL